MRGWKNKKKDNARLMPAERRNVFWICVALIAANLSVYAPLWHYGFVNYHDPEYVYQNPIVSRGLTSSGVSWALTTARDGNWMPVAWMSHMLDVQIYGLNPGGHHVTNIVLHIASTLLLFGVLYRMTRAIGASFFVAALFSLHPLQVESVAWIADRNLVLGTFFWMLTLAAYGRYVRRPRFGRSLPVLLFYALGLMTTPALVTLPFALLLLDIWPLRRLPIVSSVENESAASVKVRASVALDLLREKLPMFAIALTSTIVAVGVRRRAVSPDSLPLPSRLANALVSYTDYIVKFVWPARLSAFYNYSGSVSVLKIAGVILALLTISVVAFRQHRVRPYLAMGWLWYLGTLMPVIGLVLLGNAAMADRYVSVPLIGLAIAVAWTVRDLVATWKVPRPAVVAVAGLAVTACGIVARHQVGYWQSSVALWQHAREVSPPSYTVEANLGHLDLADGRLNEAAAHLTEAARLAPGVPEVHFDLATVLARRGQLDEAVTRYSEALRIRPDYAEAHRDLGAVLARQGNIDEAIDHYQEALRLRPDANGHYTAALMLRRQGRLAEAAEHLDAALRLEPGFGLARAARDLLRNQMMAAAKSRGERQ